MTPRELSLARLRAKRFNVLVIGGGIVGAGIARDAAMRGLSVALVEQGDFASGTSSKTSKLIHGGLRYLEHGRFRLVAESLRERQTLRTIAPGLVHPLSLILPVYQDDPRSSWKIAAGLSLYDLLAIGRNIRRHRMVSARRAVAIEPGLRFDGLRAAGLFADCQMDDARVCLANILQAISFGAAAVNYARVRTLLRSNTQRICGAVVEDAFTGRAWEVEAEAVVNATGPWADGLRRLSDPRTTERLSPSKGIHLVLPRLAREALFVQAKSDGRMVFLLPWGDYSLVGTTESAVDGPLDELSASADDVDYLLNEVNRILPGSHVGAAEIIATFAGARPLLASPGPATHASREHRIELDRWGLLSVMGGKYTTYRAMAQQAVDALMVHHRWRLDRCLTDQVSLLETVQPVSLEHWKQLTRQIDPDLLGRLLVRYGAGVFPMLHTLAREPALAQPVCPHHEYVQAELVHGVRHESACTLTDLLARRTRIAWSSCQGLDALSLITALLERYGGIASDELERQAEAYRRFLAKSLAFRREPLGFPIAS